MKLKVFIPLLIVAITASLSFAGTSSEKDIVDTAAGAKDFSTLVAAVKAAGLVDALKGDGPFTVFAPTNAAFEKLEKKKPGTLANLLKPENKEKLKAILTYHVIPGKFIAADVVSLKNGSSIKTLGGKSVKIENKKGVTVNHSKVVKTDILCGNGVIHVIDTVLIP